MALGYDVDEVKQNFDVDGITGSVSRYVTEDMQFPCYIIEIDSESKLLEYQVRVLRRMMNFSAEDSSVDADLISIYVKDEKSTVTLGKLTPRQVVAFLRLLKNCKVIGFLNKDKMLEGDLLLSLSM